MPSNTDMDVPVTITFRNFSRVTALETLIRGRFERLRRFCPVLQGGRVVVQRSDRRQRIGSDFEIHIVLKLPGENLTVEHRATTRSFRAPARGPAAADAASGGLTDLAAAIRRAFDAARRRLQDHERVFRGDIKSHTADGRRRRAS